MAIENTSKYQGVYHILGGIISPMNGIGPDDLSIDSLLEKLSKHDITEIIFALNTTMEGDTTNFYLYKKINPLNIPVSTIARGVAIGDELEYVDDITLGRSIINRTPYENNLVK
jgi:recombination protein RecR